MLFSDIILNPWNPNLSGFLLRVQWLTGNPLKWEFVLVNLISILLLIVLRASITISFVWTMIGVLMSPNLLQVTPKEKIVLVPAPESPKPMSSLLNQKILKFSKPWLVTALPLGTYKCISLIEIKIVILSTNKKHFRIKTKCFDLFEVVISTIVLKQIPLKRSKQDHELGINSDFTFSFRIVDKHKDTKWGQQKPNFDAQTYGQTGPGSNSPPSIQPGPPILPPLLLNIILNKQTENRRDPVLLPEPTSHVMFNHLYAQSIRDEMLVMATTTRIRKKCVTVIYYKPLWFLFKRVIAGAGSSVIFYNHKFIWHAQCFSGLELS